MTHTRTITHASKSSARQIMSSPTPEIPLSSSSSLSCIYIYAVVISIFSVTRGEYYNARGDQRGRPTEYMRVETTNLHYGRNILGVGCGANANVRDINRRQVSPCAQKYECTPRIRLIYLFSLSRENFQNVLRGLILFKSRAMK